jgi:hypothetical protein
MIYMVADDPAHGELLDQQANRELDQIIYSALAADKDEHKVKVAVQLDFRNRPDVWRRVIGQGGWAQPESAAADPATLYGFFDFVANACPADRYALILWGHSRGPFGLFTDRPFSSPMAGPFAQDSEQTYIAQTLTLKELRVALRTARESLNQRVDIIAFKDCFMSTLETAYELEDSADYIIASPQIVPIEGWPYREIFTALAANPEDPEKASRGLVKALKDHYSHKANRHGLKDVPFTLMSTGKLTNVNQPLRSLVTALVPAIEKRGTTIRNALRGAKRADSALLDVSDLCRRLKERGDKQLGRAADGETNVGALKEGRQAASASHVRWRQRVLLSF